MPNNFFDCLELHDDPDQIKRQKSAVSSKLTPVNIDFQSQKGHFKGSSPKPYEVSLNDCSCGDFRRTKLPCKHIYRLAHELGVFKLDDVRSDNVIPIRAFDSGAVDFLDKTTGEITSHKSKKDLLAALDDMPENLQSYLYRVCGVLQYDKEDKYFSMNAALARQLADMDYLSFLNIPPCEKIAYADRQDILSIIVRVNKSKNLKYNPRSITSTLEKFLTSNYKDDLELLNDEMVVLCASPFAPNYMSMYRKLHKILGFSTSQEDYD